MALCRCDACPICDQMFFSELMKDASDVSGCFGTRVRHLLDHHVATGEQRRSVHLPATRKIIDGIYNNECNCYKKHSQEVHGSESGKNFRSKLLAEYIEAFALALVDGTRRLLFKF